MSTGCDDRCHPSAVRLLGRLVNLAAVGVLARAHVFAAPKCVPWGVPRFCVPIAVSVTPNLRLKLSL